MMNLKIVHIYSNNTVGDTPVSGVQILSQTQYPDIRNPDTE